MDYEIAKVLKQKVFEIRGQKVMLDSDLAELYGVETKYLNRSVKRNIERFPEEFMFKLNTEEYQIVLNSRCQIGTLKQGYNLKYQPYAFTEQGVAMLSSVLRSKEAIQELISPSEKPKRNKIGFNAR